MANGSRRSLPTAPAAAAVVSEAIVAPRNTPGSQSGAIAGSCDAATQKRALGCAAGVWDSGVQSLPCQSTRCDGGVLVIPSHHTSPSSVRAQLVNTVLAAIMAIALGLVTWLVPGATPKKPASGLIAYSRPSAPYFIQAMSSPTVSTFQPAIVGISIARFVLPQADGNAPATYFTTPSGEVSLR